MQQLIITPKPGQHKDAQPLFTVVEMHFGVFKSMWEDQRPAEVLALIDSYVYKEAMVKRR